MGLEKKGWRERAGERVEDRGLEGGGGREGATERRRAGSKEGYKTPTTIPMFVRKEKWCPYTVPCGSVNLSLKVMEIKGLKQMKVRQ
jgi:hypothetical protein